jgi:hypothetical protein
MCCGGRNYAAVARIPIVTQNATLQEDFGSNRTCELLFVLHASKGGGLARGVGSN